MNSPRAARNPALYPPPSSTFADCQRYRTESPNRLDTMSGVASVEALSTTMTSTGRYDWWRALWIASSRSGQLLCVTMMMEARSDISLCTRSFGAAVHPDTLLHLTIPQCSRRPALHRSDCRGRRQCQLRAAGAV